MLNERAARALCLRRNMRAQCRVRAAVRCCDAVMMRRCSVDHFAWWCVCVVLAVRAAAARSVLLPAARSSWRCAGSAARARACEGPANSERPTLNQRVIQGRATAICSKKERARRGGPGPAWRAARARVPAHAHSRRARAGEPAAARRAVRRPPCAPPAACGGSARLRRGRARACCWRAWRRAWRACARGKPPAKAAAATAAAAAATAVAAPWLPRPRPVPLPSTAGPARPTPPATARTSPRRSSTSRRRPSSCPRRRCWASAGASTAEKTSPFRASPASCVRCRAWRRWTPPRCATTAGACCAARRGACGGAARARGAVGTAARSGMCGVRQLVRAARVVFV
jgi:hypothetical protein